METNPNAKSSASIIAQLKDDLLKGMVVTPLFGLQRYGTMDLRKRLSELRNDFGMDISSEWKESLSGKKYKIHYMTSSSICRYKESHNIQ